MHLTREQSILAQNDRASQPSPQPLRPGPGARPGTGHPRGFQAKARRLELGSAIMAGWFRKGPDYYTDKLLRTHDEWIALADGDEAGRARVADLLCKYSGKLKDTMYGDGAKDPQPAQCEKLAKVWQEKVVVARLPALIDNMDFEARKNVSMVFCALVRGDYCGFASSQVSMAPEMIAGFLRCYSDRSKALAVGPMIRESIRVESVHERLLHSGQTGPVLESLAAASAKVVAQGVREAAAEAEAEAAAASCDALPGGAGPGAAAEVEAAVVAAHSTAHAAVMAGIAPELVELMGRWTAVPNFEVAGDAFCTLTWILRGREHKAKVTKFLLATADSFLPLYMGMLQPWAGCSRYTLQLQALQLLVELLLDRDNFEFMVRFIQRTRYLRTVLTMLRSKQAAIQFEAFHVLKVFVANPSKPAPIVEVLMANRDKLVAFLRALQNDRQDDDFHNEKALLIETLEAGLKLPSGYQAKLLAPRSTGLSVPPEPAAATAAGAAGAAAAGAAAGSAAVPADSGAGGAAAESTESAAAPVAEGAAAAPEADPKPAASDAGTA